MHASKIGNTTSNGYRKSVFGTNPRIGFACKYFHPDRTVAKKTIEQIERPLNGRGTSASWLARQDEATARERMQEIMVYNLEAVDRLVRYVGTLPTGLRMVRLSSDILPLYTHHEWSDFWQEADIQQYIGQQLGQTGKFARNSSIRLSMHPGQFTVLASHDDEIVERSVEEFEYHADIARWLGYGVEFQDFKINVHISGRLGPEGIRACLPRLSPEARNCITIENEEFRWGLDATLELADVVPLVLDIHHHWINCGEYIYPDDDRVKQVIDSWRGVRPVLHYSVSREELLQEHRPDQRPDLESLSTQGFSRSKLRAHSDMYWNSACNQWAAQFTESFDIMCESKFKQVASIDFHNQIHGQSVPNSNPDACLLN